LLIRRNRLGGSVAEVTRTIADLGERRITLHVLREGVDTATPTGRAIAAIMASLAELGLELGRERRAASRESRRARHLPATKPPKLSKNSLRDSSPRLQRHRDRVAWQGILDRGATGWALGAVRKPVIDEARAERIYAEVRALAD
jgi:DNA invertase Pin-like site-specific DNA recombinase